MPAADLPEELTSQQKTVLRKQLVALRDSLETAVSAAAESAKPVDLDQPIGRLSRMDALQNQQLASANRRAHKTRLNQVIAALGRIDRDDFGLCLDCDEPIGYRRLAAKPESHLCLPCQRGREPRSG